MEEKKKRKLREKRIRRVRAKIFGTAQRPRLAVFFSNRHLYGQLIDDEKGKTLTAVSSLQIKDKKFQALKPQEKASKLGEILAENALKLKIKRAVFDRRFYKFHGKTKAFTEGARHKGLKI